MGMFDTIIVVGEQLPPIKDELAEDVMARIAQRDFQSKSMHCCMDTYVIQNKELYLKRYDWGEETSTDSFEKVNYNGMINFYTYLNDVKDKWDCWVEFDALFIDGKLHKIYLKEFSKESNCERKANQAKYQKELEDNRNKWYNKYIFHKRYYYRPRRYISKYVWKLSSGFNKIADFINWINRKIP